MKNVLFCYGLEKGIQINYSIQSNYNNFIKDYPAYNIFAYE
jgi:hypothetical protein